MEDTQKTLSRREKFDRLQRDTKINAIWLFLQEHLPENEQVNIDKLKTMSTLAIIELFNDLTGQQIKRMATRADAERRVTEELRKAGKWEDLVEGTSDKEAKNIHETAKAGANTGTKLRKEKPETTRQNLTGSLGTQTKAGKGKGKAQKPTSKPQTAAKSGKGSGKGQDGADTATPESGKRGRGAPSKNQTYTAIAPNDKTFNPKGFKPQATSDRMVVLEHIRANKGQRTRDQIVEHFKGDKVNVDAALYYLGKFGFCRVGE